MNKITETFLELTKYTCPAGHEERLYRAALEARGAEYLPTIGYLLRVGSNNTVLFTCHLDTADKGQPKKVTHVFGGLNGNVVHTDGSTILGADDKAGMAIMLHMIDHNVPGDYVFYLGEEIGMVGSGNHVEELAESGYPYTQVVSFDRGGMQDIITHQMGGRTASDAYAQTLRRELNLRGMWYNLSDGGTFTDSFQHAGLALEATNISVGYGNAHTTGEWQDLRHLERLAKACISIPWQDLPTVGVPPEESNPYTYATSMYKYKPQPTLEEVLYGGNVYDYDELYDWLIAYPDEAAAALEQLLRTRNEDKMYDDWSH